MLEAKEVSVSRAGSGKAAMRLALETAYDVVLVDARVVDIPLHTLAVDLQRLGRGAQVIVVADESFVDDLGASEEMDVWSCLVEPLTSSKVISEVRRAVRHAHLSREADALRQALELTEAGLFTLVNTVNALLLVLDEQGRVLQANEAVEDVTGVSIGELVGVSWFDQLTPEGDREEVRKAFLGLVKGGEPMTVQARISCGVHKDRQEARWVRWRAAALRDKAGRTQVYASGLDISDTREFERQAHLTEKLAAVGTLSAGLAHEIRNPLNAAGLQLRLLNRRLLTMGAEERLLEPVDLVQAELGRLSRLVGEFLQFARPPGLVRSRVDVAELARAVVDMEAPAALEKGSRIVARLPEGAVEVEGDAEKLHQVMLNLIRNAVEATAKGGKVEVGVEPGEDGLRISVTDDGEGIPEQELARIFEPFFSTKPGGTGLGMSIVHSLVTLHGGDVVVDSKEGEGTRVGIDLPDVPP